MKRAHTIGEFDSDAALQVLVSNGWTPEQIARRTNQTPKQIYNRARKLQIDVRREYENSWRRGCRVTVAPPELKSEPSPG
jgi:hypothetical protein